MSEQHAPYLHLVRPAPATAPTSSSSLEGAQEAETPDVGNQASLGDLPTSAPPPLEDGAASDGPASEPATQASSAASAALSQAIMYATMSWLALCVERVAVAVDIQPLADRLYEVSVHYDSADEEHSDGIILRVRLDVEPGLVVRSTVEPLRP